MALAQTDLPELKRFTFFVSRRFEEGRERFRLHMGYFATLAEAEEWLGVVREIYPGAWAGEAPGRKLRERAVAAAAAQAQQAAGPPPRAAAPAPAPARSVAAPPPPPPVHVPVLHAAPAAAQVAPPRRSAAPARSANALRDANPIAPASAARRPAAAPPVRSVPAAAARAAASSAPARAGAKSGKPVFEDSNVREVLQALGDSAATGETRLMHAPPPPRASSSASATHDSLSDSQVLKILEERRQDGNERPVDVRHDGIALLKPDDTGTRKALRDALTHNAPVSFAVQLQWSVQPVQLDKVPPLAIFSAYTLYTVEGSREGRKWYGLRLGFFTDALSAKQVAYYVRSEFTSVAVVPVSPQERARASGEDKQATAAAKGSRPTSRADRSDEFKLFDDSGERRALAQAAAAMAEPAPTKPATKAAASAARGPKGGAGRARLGSRVGAHERRGAKTLEETLEILGASALSIDDGRGASLDESGVRHLRIKTQRNSPFTKLLERLSERMKKP